MPAHVLRTHRRWRVPGKSPALPGPTPSVPKLWIQAQRDPARAFRHGLLCKAVRYAIDQHTSLLAHLGNGRLPIYNNDAESDLRHFVTSRKNSMAFASEKGGRVAAASTHCPSAALR